MPATPETTAFADAVNRGPHIQDQDRRPPARRQIVQMQAVLLAGLASPDEPLSSKAQAARAWDVLEDRLREFNGKPKLAPVKAEPKSRRRAPVVMHPDDVPASVAPSPGVVESPSNETITSPPPVTT